VQYFPKIKKIEKQYIIELWMANAFISPPNRISEAEDVGDGV